MDIKASRMKLNTIIKQSENSSFYQNLTIVSEYKEKISQITETIKENQDTFKIIEESGLSLEPKESMVEYVNDGTTLHLLNTEEIRLKSMVFSENYLKLEELGEANIQSLAYANFLTEEKFLDDKSQGLLNEYGEIYLKSNGIKENFEVFMETVEALENSKDFEVNQERLKITTEKLLEIAENEESLNLVSDKLAYLNKYADNLNLKPETKELFKDSLGNFAKDLDVPFYDSHRSNKVTYEIDGKNKEKESFDKRELENKLDEAKSVQDFAGKEEKGKEEKEIDIDFEL